MAVIGCAECGGKVSDTAAACPQCGAPTAQAAVRRADAMRRVRPAVVALVALTLGPILYFEIRRLDDRGDEKARRANKEYVAAVMESVRHFVADERIELKQGTAKKFSIPLPSRTRIRVQVIADPYPVDVLLMTANEAEEFKAEMGESLGRKFENEPELSSRRVMRMDQTLDVPAGGWTLIVVRPGERPLPDLPTLSDLADVSDRMDTSAHVTVTTSD
jgi:hypothetical protein